MSEEGLGAIEYDIMLLLIVLVCLVAMGTIGENTNSMFQKAASSVK